MSRSKSRLACENVYLLEHLTTAANVCIRFRQIAESAFRLRFQKYYLEDTDVEPAIFVRCLRIFSPSKVRIRTNNNDKIFGAIAEFGHNLEELSIRIVCPQPHANAAIRSLLPKLKAISVTKVDFLSEVTVVDWQLERLHLYHYYGRLPVMPSIKLPKLKELYMYNSCLDYLKDFMTSNGHIEQLQLHRCTVVGQRDLRSIAVCVPNLKELTFVDVRLFPDDGENTNESSGSHFKCLQKVTIWEHLDINVVITNLLIGSSVQHLDLWINGTDAIVGLDRLTSITRLTLRPFERVTVADLLEYANSISGLQELQLRVGTNCYFTMGCIKRLIKESKRITKLSIRWQKKEEFGGAPELEEIAALIAVRPNLCVEVELPRKWFKVPDIICRQYSGWLKLIELNPEYVGQIECAAPEALYGSDEGSIYDEYSSDDGW